MGALALQSDLSRSLTSPNYAGLHRNPQLDASVPSTRYKKGSFYVPAFT